MLHPGASKGSLEEIETSPTMQLSFVAACASLSAPPLWNSEEKGSFSSKDDGRPSKVIPN